MAEELIRLDIVTPAGILMSETVEMVNLPATLGSMGVMKNHAPLMTTLDIGQVKYRQGGKEHYLAVCGGFAEVKNNVVIVLADAAEKAEDIDLQRAEAARERALARLRSKSSDVDVVRAEWALRRAINRIKTHELR